jgi:hypothetical protein
VADAGGDLVTLGIVLFIAKLLLATIYLLPGIRGESHFGGDHLSWQEVYRLAAPYSWDAVRMTDIFVTCESLGYTRAVSPTLDFGLAQVNLPLHARRFGLFPLIFDPAYNVWAGSQIYAGGGEARWMCAPLVAPRED